MRSASLLVLRLLAGAFLVSVAAWAGACGGASAPPPFEAGTPADPPPGGGGGGTVPPPAPPEGPAWDPDAATYGRVAASGSFPSDLVRHGDTLFAVDADAVEGTGARILAFDVSGARPVPSTRFATTTILPSDLRDTQGNPLDPTTLIGFGAFVNDLLIAEDTLGFALVNAGGSDTVPGLCNVVAFDPLTGAVLQAFDLGLTVVSGTPIFDSSGMRVPGDRFVQGGAEGMAFIRTSPTAGRLFVAMSNLVFGPPSYGAVKYPGTLVGLDVAPASRPPLSLAYFDAFTPWIVMTRAYNPVAVSLIDVPAGIGQQILRLIVTVAGTTGYDAQFNLVPLTESAVECYDAGTGAYEGRFALGLAGLAAVRPALGLDAARHHVGFFPSAATGEIYLLRLDGLHEPTIDPSRLAVLRGLANGIPITAALSGGPGGNLTGVALAPGGRTLVVTGFGDLFAFPPVPGQIFLASLPSDLVTGAGFGVDFVPGSTVFASVPGRTLGNVVLVPSGGTSADVYVNVSGTLDGSFLGSGAASLGALDTRGLIE